MSYIDMATVIPLHRGAMGLDQNFIDRFPTEIVYWPCTPQLLGCRREGEW
jgi:hypothetical protein